MQITFESPGGPRFGVVPYERINDEAMLDKSLILKPTRNTGGLNVRFILLFLCLPFAATAYASGSASPVKFKLQFDRECIYTSKSGRQCSAINWTRTLLKQGGSWIWANEMRGDLNLRVVKEDEYVAVLEGPLGMTHSAVDQIYLSKKTGRFYWSEIGYSTVLEHDHASIQSGSYRSKKIDSEGQAAASMRPTVR